MDGKVDHSLPIQEASKKLVRLLEDMEGWRRRPEKKDLLGSLVPVGSNEETVFVSDNVMDAMMKDKKMNDSMFFRKSNLESETGRLVWVRRLILDVERLWVLLIPCRRCQR